MAGSIVLYYRNYNSSDTTKSTAYVNYDPCPTIDTIGWSAPSGKLFKEWNTSRDGSGASMNPGTAYADGGDVRYAIWQDEPTEYLTNDQEITSIADAIRAKGGTSTQLIYPAGFVSAIGAITTPYPSADGVSFGTVPSTISFSIHSASRTADSGMTWAEWVASEYNPTYQTPFGTYPLYGIDGNNIKDMRMAMYIYADNSTRVLKTDAIIENKDYPWGY